MLFSNSSTLLEFVFKQASNQAWKMFSQCQTPASRGSLHLDCQTRYAFIQSTEVACFKGLKISKVFGILILKVRLVLLFGFAKEWRLYKQMVMMYWKLELKLLAAAPKFNYPGIEIEFKRTSTVIINVLQIHFTVTQLCYAWNIERMPNLRDVF